MQDHVTPEAMIDGETGGCVGHMDTLLYGLRPTFLTGTLYFGA